jgi:transcriptional regulator with GAF, ATPase, and Fis domain
MQIKLLRVLAGAHAGAPWLQHAPSPSTAVSSPPPRMICSNSAASGGFRNDLYYRLSVATLALPPLRERREDIPAALRALPAPGCRPPSSVPCPSMAALFAYSSWLATTWPGNVRELRNVADRCVLGIESGSPPFGQTQADGPTPLAETVEAFERALISRRPAPPRQPRARRRGIGCGQDHATRQDKKIRAGRK